MKEYIVEYETEQIENNTFFYGGKIKRELIRCKDCKLNPKRMWVGCPMAHCLDRTDEWYCPVGKPKEGEE